MRLSGRTVQIGELAEQSGLTPDTLRYYERRGLLATPARSAGGFRLYPPDTLDRLRFIRQSQSVGLSLDDISALLDFNGKRGKAHCRGVQKLLTSRLADLDAKIDALTTFRHMLSAYLDACEHAVQTERNPRCPVMDDLTTRSIEPCPAEY